MFNSEEYRIIKLLIESKKDKPTVTDEVNKILGDILDKISQVDDFTLSTSITNEEINTVNSLVTSIEGKINRYVNLKGNLVVLEEIKKEITGDMVYLSSFRDKFIYEVEFLDEVFRKELFSQLVKEISVRDGISVTQAEKLVNIDERYKKVRRDLNSLKQIIGILKTKYSFFEKSLQLIIQSVSVAGKELQNSKMDN